MVDIFHPVVASPLRSTYRNKVGSPSLTTVQRSPTRRLEGFNLRHFLRFPPPPLPARLQDNDFVTLHKTVIEVKWPGLRFYGAQQKWTLIKFTVQSRMIIWIITFSDYRERARACCPSTVRQKVVFSRRDSRWWQRQRRKDPNSVAGEERTEKKSLRGIARPDQQTTQSSTGTNEHHNRIKNLFESFLSIFSFPRHFAYGTGKWNRHTISLGATVVAVEPPSQNTVD